MPRSSNESTDAITLLKTDHRTVEDLFERFESTNGKATKAKIAQQVCMELMVHATIEEEIFYPAIKEAVDEEIHHEAYVEHDGAKVLIAEILGGSLDDEFYDAKVKVLSEMIKHHVKEEEQRDGMFAQAKKADVDMRELGVALAARKAELTAEFKRNGIPPPQTRVMRGGEIRRGEPADGMPA
jgi:hemerythrin superfamily protein